MTSSSSLPETGLPAGRVQRAGRVEHLVAGDCADAGLERDLRELLGQPVRHVRRVERGGPGLGHQLAEAAATEHLVAFGQAQADLVAEVVAAAEVDLGSGTGLGAMLGAAVGRFARGGVHVTPFLR